MKLQRNASGKLIWNPDTGKLWGECCPSGDESRCHFCSPPLKLTYSLTVDFGGACSGQFPLSYVFNWSSGCIWLSADGLMRLEWQPSPGNPMVGYWYCGPQGAVCAPTADSGSSTNPCDPTGVAFAMSASSYCACYPATGTGTLS